MILYIDDALSVNNYSLAYLLCLVDVFFHRLSEYLWVQTGLFFSPTCSFIRTRQPSYRGFPRKTKMLARTFHITFRYIEDVLSLNNLKFGDFVDHIYHIEFEIKDTIDTARVLLLDLHIGIDSEVRLRTNLYDKRYDFNFPIVSFPFICSNILATPVHGVHISQLIR